MKHDYEVFVKLDGVIRVKATNPDEAERIALYSRNNDVLWNDWFDVQGAQVLNEDEPIEPTAKQEVVNFAFEGKAYKMSRDAIEAAYRFREAEYRTADAEAAVASFVFGDDPECLDENEYQECIKYFENLHGVKYLDLQVSIPEIVDIFFCKQDCNIAENDIWASAIEDQIARLKLR